MIVTMSTSRWFSALGLAGALIAGVAMAAQAQATAPPETAVRLKGGWQLNVEKSTIPPVPVGLMPSAPGRGDQKKGGLTGGMGGGSQDAPPEPESQLQAKAALREVQPPPTGLFINFSAADVTFTTMDGTIRRFNTDGKQQSLQIGDLRTTTKTSWMPNGALTQELQGGSLRLYRKWAVSDDGSQLIVTVRAEGGGDRTPPPPMMMVYDKK
jgi:hypothetical protein